MIKRLSVKNFGPFESAEVNFDDFNVILGRNGAGKSLLFCALRALGRVSRFPLRSGRNTPMFGGYPTRTGQVRLRELVHRGDVNRIVTLAVDFDARGVQGTYEVQLKDWQNPGGTIVAESLDVEGAGASVRITCDAEGNVQGNVAGLHRGRLRTPRFLSIPVTLYRSSDPKESGLAEKIQAALWEGIGVFRLDPTALKNPAEVGRKLSATGYNFAAHLDGIRNSEGGKAEFDALMARFREMAPHVEDILLPTDDRSEEGVPHKRIDLVMTAGSTIPADLESDGTVLLLAYSALLHGAHGHETICIEEPENGLHPKIVPQLASLLRDLSGVRGERPPTQVLVCTHSLPFFETMQRTPDVFRLVRKGADGRSIIEAPDPNKIPVLPGWAGLT